MNCFFKLKIPNHDRKYTGKEYGVSEHHFRISFTKLFFFQTSHQLSPQFNTVVWLVRYFRASIELGQHRAHFPSRELSDLHTQST